MAMRNETRGRVTDPLEERASCIRSFGAWYRVRTRRADDGVRGPVRSRSFNNTLLIWAQHLDAYEQGRVPAPTRRAPWVAGFRDWKKMGRWTEAGGSMGHSARRSG